MVKFLADPATVRRLGDQGLDPKPSTPAALTAYMRVETERFLRIIKLAGLGVGQ